MPIEEEQQKPEQDQPQRRMHHGSGCTSLLRNPPDQRVGYPPPYIVSIRPVHLREKISQQSITPHHLQRVCPSLPHTPTTINQQVKAPPHSACTNCAPSHSGSSVPYCYRKRHSMTSAPPQSNNMSNPLRASILTILSAFNPVTLTSLIPSSLFISQQAVYHTSPDCRAAFHLRSPAPSTSVIL